MAVAAVQWEQCSAEQSSTRCSGAGVSPLDAMRCVIERTAVLSNANSVHLPPGNSNLTQLSSPAAAACAFSLSPYFSFCLLLDPSVVRRAHALSDRPMHA